MFVRQLTEFAADLRRLTAGLDARELLPTEAAQVVELTVRLRHQLSALEAGAAARVAESRVWRAGGAASPAEWFAARTGEGVSAARDALATANRAASQPEVDSAMRRGDLSPAQAFAISDAAATAPAKQSELIGAAKSLSLNGLRDACRKVKQNHDPDPHATHERLRKERRWFERSMPDGAVRFGAVTTADDAAWVRAALHCAADELWANAVERGDAPESPAAYRLDALVGLCRDAAEGDMPAGEARTAPTDVDDPRGDGDGDGTAPTTDHGKGDPQHGRKRPKVRRPALGVLALLRIDLAALQRGVAEGDETCDLGGLGPISVPAARALLDDATLKLVITRGVEVVHVTHLGRRPTVAQRVALTWTSPGCTITGCDRTIVDADHTVDWARTKHTRLDELANKCTHHHTLKTRHGWETVTTDRGDTIMVPPTDPRHPRHRPVSGGDDIATQHQDRRAS